MNKIEEYFSTKAISNSLLGTLSNPRWLKIKMDNPDSEDEDKVHFRIGSALDCQLTSPELWEEQFLVIDATRPMGFMGKFIDNLPPGLDPYLDDLDKYQEAYDKAGYKMSLQKVVEKFWKTSELLEYYLATRNIDRSKTILSKEEYDIVCKAKELLLANDFVEMYFRPLEDVYELMTQVPIYFKYRNVTKEGEIIEEDCKALLDGILIDHQTQTIQPYDLKTTGKSVYEFEKAYLDYGYYRQCAFYELAISSKESPIYDLIQKGYKILDFLFIVVETKMSSSHPAIIFKTSLADRIRGLAGGYVNKRYYKGIDELIEAYKFHRDTDYWNLPLDVFNNKGRINLSVFNND